MGLLTLVLVLQLRQLGELMVLSSTEAYVRPTSCTTVEEDRLGLA